MNQDFEVRSAEGGPRTTILHLSGRLDARSARELLARCAEVRGAGRNLVLNLSGVTFVASSGIGLLLTLVEEFRMARGVVRLTALSPAADSVIRLLNLDQFLTIYASDQDALGALEAA